MCRDIQKYHVSQPSTPWGRINLQNISLIGIVRISVSAQKSHFFQLHTPHGGQWINLHFCICEINAMPKSVHKSHVCQPTTPPRSQGNWVNFWPKMFYLKLNKMLRSMQKNNFLVTPHPHWSSGGVKVNSHPKIVFIS